MSDVIQKIMEGMIPDFEELQTSGMFTEVRPNALKVSISSLY